MDRKPPRQWQGWLVVMALAVVALPAGCTSMMSAALYVAKGTNVNAQYDGLKGKRVVVVCRPAASVQYSSTSVAKELGQQISQRLEKNVRKIQIVDPSEVDDWADENDWDDPREVGRAMQADMVLAVDLEHFSLYQGQTLFQGKAVYSFRVYDLAADSRQPLYERTPPEATYPPNIAIPTSEMREPEFRRKFVSELAEEISRHFYNHDSRVDFAKDSEAILR